MYVPSLSTGSLNHSTHTGRDTRHRQSLTRTRTQTQGATQTQACKLSHKDSYWYLSTARPAGGGGDLLDNQHPLQQTPPSVWTAVDYDCEYVSVRVRFQPASFQVGSRYKRLHHNTRDSITTLHPRLSSLHTFLCLCVSTYVGVFICIPACMSRCIAACWSCAPLCVSPSHVHTTDTLTHN